MIATESDSDFGAFCAQIRQTQKKKTMMVDLMKMVAKMTAGENRFFFQPIISEQRYR